MVHCVVRTTAFRDLAFRRAGRAARVLTIDSQILLMDEPFAAVDAQTRAILQEELQRFWLTSPKTVVFVTHSVEEAVFLADRVAVMTSRPGVVKEIVEVDLPGPRDIISDVFNHYRRDVTQTDRGRGPQGVCALAASDGLIAKRHPGRAARRN